MATSTHGGSVNAGLVPTRTVRCFVGMRRARLATQDGKPHSSYTLRTPFVHSSYTLVHPSQAAVDGLIDGAFYNAGQSCCYIERVYVHESVHDRFIESALEAVRAYRLGDPFDEETTMGPLALPSAPAFLAAQVADAVSKGAKLLCGGEPTSDAKGNGRFFAPTLLIECDHTMDLMVEESFGPVLGVQKVSADAEVRRPSNLRLPHGHEARAPTMALSYPAEPTLHQT